MSGELRVRIEGIDKVIHHFDRAQEEFRDMRPLMRRMLDQFHKDMEEVWNKGQEEWADWSPAYAKWRSGDHTAESGYITSHLAARGVSFGGAPFGPMLDLSGRLRSSLTSKTADSIAIINRRSITFGTDVPYATYVKEGGDVQGKYGPPKKSSWDWVDGSPPKERADVDPYRLPRDFTAGFGTEAMKARWRRITENYARKILS